MNISAILDSLENLAPPSLQEDYDNAGLITGDKAWTCTGILICLDTTEEVVAEAKRNKCNLVVAHHPIVFRGLKKINGSNYVERTIIAAIKNDIAIYAIHTNLDNVLAGVNGKIADQLGLIHRSVLLPKQGSLHKLAVFVPVDHKDHLLNVMFEAGAGKIGQYSECSFSSEGIGTFKAGVESNPFVGNVDERHHEKEARIEVIFPGFLKRNVITAMIKAHPYEEVAYDLYNLSNEYQSVGSGLVGQLAEETDAKAFLQVLKDKFNLKLIKHTPFLGNKIKTVAVCGGSGSFLIGAAKAAGVDMFVTSDLKYHEFFDADGKMTLADIGHFESEQFTIDLIFDHLKEKFPNFAVLKTGVNTNPVRYF